MGQNPEKHQVQNSTSGLITITFTPAPEPTMDATHISCSTNASLNWLNMQYSSINMAKVTAPEIADGSLTVSADPSSSFSF